MSILFLNSVYAEALNVNSTNLKNHPNVDSLLSELRNCDVKGVVANSRAFVSIVNSFYKEKFSVFSSEKSRNSIGYLNVDEFMADVKADVVDEETNKLMPNLKACAVMDGTVVVWQCEENSKLSFADAYASAVGEVKGTDAMLASPNWCA